MGLLATTPRGGRRVQPRGGGGRALPLWPAYMLGAQLGGSWTRPWRPDEAGTDSAGAPGGRVPVALDDRAAHIGQVYLDRTARHWGYLVTLRDVPADFVTETGFVRRTGFTSVSGGNRVSWYGAPGALVEELDFVQGWDLLYTGRDFWRGDGGVEGELGLDLSAELRGNHEVEVGVGRGFYTLDPADYAGYSLPSAGRDPDRRRPGGAGHADGRAERRMDGRGVVVLQVDGRRVRGGVRRRRRSSRRGRGEGSGRWRRRWRCGPRRRCGWTPACAACCCTASATVRATRARWCRGCGRSTRSPARSPCARLAQYAVEEVDVLRTPDGRPYLREGEPFRVRRGNRPAWDAPQLNPLRLDLLLSWRPTPARRRSWATAARSRTTRRSASTAWPRARTACSSSSATCSETELRERDHDPPPGQAPGRWIVGGGPLAIPCVSGKIGPHGYKVNTSECTISAASGPPAVVGRDGRTASEWRDYTAMGFTAEHVPALLRMSADPELNEADSDDPRVYAPLHAWRVLGQLGVAEAAVPLESCCGPSTTTSRRRTCRGFWR